ncbi:multifunctional oxoglutarate decarboxylase/oxoglutarate dehydrogenase thiamine pyrophosphate-binding subunit/dihydrolipoyllysine-residue succinyltransferase subunit [Mobiluncus mulieris]|uniref:multifunctional oxoglutarate decarboxylase/oxoglutarate dehydrogenase thiamine pyrophosphate-binding subunit/dihydrolipoyllysine-residue succinyltransferase subunit n=1 Tax=Mobiluncus mulieris TaxID=2052 RepID=UPI00242B62C0|nr:multifunctional oxoglutarate decarboxylase/oxoglutarate dehydrogenase thiamine pyrophosphate-binding subunit/dihydrolipoyllysine-residue succinyltransferase subunit [Mobiluncus mulieris]
MKGITVAQTQVSGNQASPEFIAEYYRQYLQDSQTVSPEWRSYFQQMESLGLMNPDGVASRDTELAPHEAAPSGQTAPSPAPESETRVEAYESTPTAIPARTLDVSRSDLPPAPRSRAADPSSPYAAREAAEIEHNRHLAPAAEDQLERLKGINAVIAKNMEASLSVPIATSYRQIPAKVLIENRIQINDHLRRTRGGKVSFTHLIGYAIVEALSELPEMNVRYELRDGKPYIFHPAHVGFGLAIDLPKDDGSRLLVTPVVPKADTLSFHEFVAAYEELVRKAREGKLTMEDYNGATVTLTNPGTLGTLMSSPRLMVGQGSIIGVGATAYPAEWAGASDEQLARAGVGKIMHMSSTYDHRVIQGALSGTFLGTVEKKLKGEDGFYERVFNSEKVPYDPYGWVRNEADNNYSNQYKAANVQRLIHAYRSSGHLIADTDPLDYRVRHHPDLCLCNYGLSIWDLDTEFPIGVYGGKKNQRMTLRELLGHLRDTYTRTSGIEYMHIQDPEQRDWMQREIEQPYEPPTKEVRAAILNRLNAAEAFESFLQTKYVGQKRFSLEGGESLIPLLLRVMDDAAHDGLAGVTIGMAHRGRLNVLVNVAGKSNAQIFSEFEGNLDPGSLQGSGDVKYHLGTESVYESYEGCHTQVYIAANPSHLEAVDPVVQGIVRAQQDKVGIEGDYGYMPVLIHGDAAFVGQGVVYETLNMSQLKAYKTGGTLHIIVNNQIGFTTSPTNARSTIYCTDLAKGLQVPIFHVNADDPEMVTRVAGLAYRFQQKFHKDVIIDMLCYRRRGHNEGDDPSMTQPVMYGLIDNLPSTRTVYVNNLIGRGDITDAEAKAAMEDFRAKLERIFEETKEHGYKPTRLGEQGGNDWNLPASQTNQNKEMIGWTSAIPLDVLQRIGDSQVAYPEDFAVHPKVAKLLQRRQTMTREGNIDWGFGELLAFGSILMEGTPIRMSGEDARRATFVQRHAVIHDHLTGQEWTPLAFLTPDQGDFMIYDSSLSEFAPLGFEYGYSVERPEALTLWEAQFGDFTFGGQTIIDEFISSSAQKWHQHSSLVLLLPHGFEGQGPDHSSARIERFLALCAEDNMWVVQPSTPANHFHMLRAQAYRHPRTPLVVFTPKQLLRLRAAVSQISDFTSGEFQRAIGDTAGLDAAGVSRVIICTGRVYYDLAAERDKRQDRTTAIVRLEQYYPLHDDLREILDSYPNAELVWVQDEPANQGAWTFVSAHRDVFTGGRDLRLVSRPAMAAPSTGNSTFHKEQALALMEAAFGATL